MESWSAVLGSQSGSYGDYYKIGHENGSKLWPSFKRNIWM